jgi:hypothetical protein
MEFLLLRRLKTLFLAKISQKVNIMKFLMVLPLKMLEISGLKLEIVME